jgi:hypothetical protein
VKLKAPCFLPSAPQFLEMFFLTKLHAHLRTQNYAGIAVISYTALPSNVCDSAAFMIQKTAKKQFIQKNIHISSQ